MSKSEEILKGFVSAALLVICFIILIVGNAKEDNTGSEVINKEAYTYHANFDKINAWIAARKFVKQELAYPETAKFDDRNGSEYVTKVNDNIYEVESFVHAKNAFNQIDKRNFCCRIKYDGYESWKLLEIDIW